ncbi:hypothetical protein D3C87_421270 [compost metagenome]
MTRRKIVFLFNLLQDVNIIRPVALLAREMDVDVAFLCSHKFAPRDKQQVWTQILNKLAAECGATISEYDSPFAAYRLLQGGCGALVAASESNLPPHVEVHDVFRAAPSGYTRVTLQHGFECIGFLQNREHDKAHGRNVRFAADILATWMPSHRMTSMAQSERDKVFLTGPGLLLQQGRHGVAPAGQGIVCENLHSVRLSASGDFRQDFMTDFGHFCAHLATRGETVCLRPHPGGQFLTRNGIAAPSNAHLDARPIHEVDLSAFTFGVSAPSSVVLDMVLADLPTAVWADTQGAMDTDNYDGLTLIRRQSDWLAFHRDVNLRPDMIRQRQDRFLKQLEMPLDAADVRQRFIDLLALATHRFDASPTRSHKGGST